MVNTRRDQKSRQALDPAVVNMDRTPIQRVPKEIQERFNTVFGGPRIPLEQKELSYNKKVLVGQWFEESRKFLRHDYPRETIYETEYVNPNVSPETVLANRNISYDQAINSLGEPMTLSDLGYSTNYATLYDLTYNRAAPGLLKETLRKYSASGGGYFPERDYCLNHVGGVNKGLLACKLEEWENDHNLDDVMYLTTTKQDYVPHSPHGHKIHKAMPVNLCEVALDRLKLECKEFPSKNEAVCYCVEHPEVCWVEPRNPKNILPSL